MHIRKQQLGIVANSVAIALMISEQFIAYSARILLGINSGVGPIVSFVSLLLELVSLYFCKGIKLNKKNVALYSYILLFFVFSFVITRGSHTREYLIEFLAYGTFALMAAENRRDDQLILTIIMMLSVIFWLAPTRMVSSGLMSQLDYNRIEMYASYVLIIPISATIVHVLFCPSRKWQIKLLYILNIGQFVLIFTSLGRGPMLLLLITAVICVNRISLNKGHFWNAKRAAVIIFGGLASILFILNFNVIIISINTYLERHGIVIAVFKKIVRLLDRNLTVFNNRESVWSNSYAMIINSPLWGNGIASYANKYEVWPHNLFLQLLVEMGVIGCIPLFIPIIKKWKSVIIDIQCKYLSSVFILVMCLSCIRLMFSTYLWHLPEFWLFFFFLPSLNRNVIKGLNDDKQQV